MTFHLLTPRLAMVTAAVLSSQAPTLQAAGRLDSVSALPAPRHTVDPYGTTPVLRPGGPRRAAQRQVPIDTPSLTAAPTAKWTYLVFIDGDNDLEDYVTSDLEDELAAQGSNDDVQVVALADRAQGYNADRGNWTGTKLFHVTQGMTATEDNAIADWGERNMGDPQTLVDFLQWAQTYFPAEHYALVFWDHGWEWRPGNTMLDEADNDTLDQDEIAAALEAAGPIDVVGYDACLMQTLEVQATLRPYVSALAASEDYVGYEGFKHDEVIEALWADPDMDADALAVALAASMTDRSISAVALDARWDNLEMAVDRWAQALTDGLPKYRKTYDDFWRSIQGFGDPLTKDLYHAALTVKAKVPDATIQAASQDVLDAMDAVLLYEWHRNYYQGAYGITVFWPQKTRDLDYPASPENDFVYYRGKLAFSAETRWDEFIDAYVNQR